MVGLVCHSSFKAPALEANFTMNHLCGERLASAKSNYTCANSDTEFGRRVLMLAGSYARAPQRDGHHIPSEILPLVEEQNSNPDTFPCSDT